MAKVRLTPGRIKAARCPADKKQIFLWDSDVRGLAVRVTKGTKVFIYQARYGSGRNAKDIRLKISAVTSFTIEAARQRARAIAVLISKGIDPRLEKKRVETQEAVERQEIHRQDLTIAEIWPIYLEDRKHNWSTKYYLDHLRIAHPGGQKKIRGKGKTVPGALASITHLPLTDVTADVIKRWLTMERVTRPTETRRAFEMLRTFLNWCDAESKYKGLVSLDSCTAKIKKDYLKKKNARSDCLQKEQLPAWFSAVKSYSNKVLSAYCQMLLLSGARREELLSLTWPDVDQKWLSITITGKGGVQRVIPLTPYMAYLLSNLPRRNRWVFSSPRSREGRLQSPTRAHMKMIAVAGIEGLTLHGLRRSFGTLSEWVETPVGIVYQIQGHRPSATAEKHYRPRPLDLLRMWHIKIEEWILEQAGIELPEKILKNPTLKLLQGGEK